MDLSLAMPLAPPPQGQLGTGSLQERDLVCARGGGVVTRRVCLSVQAVFLYPGSESPSCFDDGNLSLSLSASRFGEGGCVRKG